MWIVELLPSLHFKCYRAFIFITTQLANTMTIKHFFSPLLREWNTLHLIHSKIQMHSCSSRVCQGYYCLTQIAWRVKLLGGVMFISQFAIREFTVKLRLSHRGTIPINQKRSGGRLLFAHHYQWLTPERITKRRSFTSAGENKNKIQGGGWKKRSLFATAFSEC